MANSKISAIFNKIGNTIKKKKWIAIIAVLIVIVVAIAIAKRQSASDDTETVTGTVEMVEVRNIANSISGNGTVVTAASEDVSADVSGLEVKAVLVEENQVIEAGTVIALLDTSTIQEDIDDVNQQIADIRADQAEQDADYDERIADAEKDRANSINENYYKWEQTQNDIKTAQADYDAAVTARDEAKKAYNDYETKLAEEKAAGQTITSTELMEESNLSTKLQTAENKVTSTKASLDNYNNLSKTYYDNIQNENGDTTPDDLRENKADYDESIEDQIENYQEQIDNYNEEIGKAHLVSTISGVITALNVEVGDTYSGGTAATIKNLDAFVVEAQIDEYDIADVQVGQNALIKTDATRDDELTGVVSYVALTTDNTGSTGSSVDLSGLLGSSTGSSALSSLTGSSSSSDSATYLIKIRLDNMDDRLRIGMNARVSVLTEEAADVLSLPYDALQTDADGSIYVNVVTAGENPEDEDFAYKQVKVTEGLQGTYYVEVSGDGISEGTKVFVPAEATNTSVTDILNEMGSDAGV